MAGRTYDVEVSKHAASQPDKKIKRDNGRKREKNRRRVRANQRKR